MEINGFTKGQYKQLCPISWRKCNGDEKSLEYKIKRAVDLGKVTYTYKNGCKLIRYYYFNFLVDDKEIMTMWQDKSQEPYLVTEKQKMEYKPKIKKEQKIRKRLSFLRRLFE